MINHDDANYSIEQTLASEIDTQHQQISPEVSQRLANARANAVNSYTAPKHSMAPWYVGGSAVATCALVVALLLPVGNSTLDQPMVADKDLVENLEFYVWLAEQPVTE